MRELAKLIASLLSVLSFSSSFAEALDGGSRANVVRMCRSV